MVKEKLWYKKEIQKLREDVEDLERYIKEFSFFLPIAVCDITPIGIIININRVFQEITGHRKSEIIGKKAEDLFLDKKKFQDLEKELLSKKLNLVEEGVIFTKERKKIPVKIAVSIRKDEEENLIGYFLALSDISGIKSFQKKLEEKVEERTKELEDKTKELAKSRIALMNILEDVEAAKKIAEEERDKTLSVIENFPEGLLFFDKDNKLFSINPIVQDIFTLSNDGLIGKKPKDLMNIPSLNPLIKIFGEELKEVFKKELKLGKEVILEVSTIIISREGEKIGTLVVLRDITREKLIEKSKTEFVSITAHQLRTPLSAIKWTLKMFLDGDVGEIAKEQYEFLRKTYESNERMIHLINDLLNVTRIEEGRFLYNVKNQDIIRAAETVITPLEKVARKKGLEFKFKKPLQKIPGVKMDTEKLSFAFQNLITNAIHYTEPGGKIEISIDYLEQKKEILFLIKDSGIGIPKDQHKRVFSRFFRAANAIKVETDGTGLGLYIAKNIIEAHKGKIWFKSEEGKGTTFYFTLPVS